MMKGFNKRERRIIRWAYSDAARICWEREWEAHNDERRETPEAMAAHLKDLMPGRAHDILKYGCDLPKPRKLTKVTRFKLGKFLKNEK